MIHFFTLFFKFFIVFHFIYFIGKIIRSFVSLAFKAEKLETFYNVFVGLLSCTFFYSFFKSGFSTSLILLIPIILYFLHINKFKIVKFRWTKIQFKNEILPFYILLLLVFIYQSSSYFNFSTFKIRYLFVDNYTYANVVSILHDFGTENVDYSLDKYLPNFQSELVPYRYADLWLSSFTMDLVNVKDIESFYLIVIPLLISLLAYFYYSLLYSRTNKKIFSVILSVLLLFVSITFIPLLNSGDKLPYISETSFMGTFQQKLAFSSLFFVLGFNYWKTNRENALLFFMFIPFFYVAYLPSIWIGLSCYFVYKWKKNKFIIRINSATFRLFLLLIFITLSYWLFYKFNGHFFAIHNKMNWKDIPIVKRLPKEIIDPNTSFNLKACISNFFCYSLPEIFFYLKGAIGNLILGTLFLIPFVVLLFIKLGNYLSELKFIFLLLFLGLVFTIIKDGDYNNYQFYTNGLVMFSILFSLVFIKNYSKSLINYIFCLVVICFNLIPIFSFRKKISEHQLDYNFLKKVENNLKYKTDNQVFCFVSTNSFDDSFYSWVGGNVLMPLKQMTKNNILFSIANPSIYFEQESRPHAGLAYDWSVVNNWTKIHKKNEIDFIFDNHIKFLLFYPNVKIPSEINKRVIKIIYSNKYRFVEIILDVSH